MANARREVIDVTRRFLRKNKPEGHGPLHESNDGWVDPKPYVRVFNNGMFEGYDGSLWLYFGFPTDVKISWLSRSSEAVMNQTFINTMFREIGSRLDNQTERTKNDLRRSFHISLSQNEYKGIRPYEGIAPAHEDYLKRMSLEYTKPEWFGYVGFQLQTSSVLYDAHGLRNKVKQYIDFMLSPDMIKMALFKEDIEFLNNLMTGPQMGFRPLDFTAPNKSDGRHGSEDYDQLTAWYGIEDSRYGIKRKLDNTRMAEPVHGNSLILPKTWGQTGRSNSEVTFHAIKPKEDMFLVDPESNLSQWGVSLFSPAVNAVATSIRGQIRSSRVAANAFDLKQTGVDKKRQRSASKGNPYSSIDKMTIKDSSKLGIATEMVSAQGGMPFLDNVEIIVGTLVTEYESALPSVLSDHGLDSVPLIGRQPDAILSTLPTFPKPIFRVRQNNTTRSVLSNQMLPGIISFSGLFRSTKPAETSGIVLGLSDSGHEYKEIMTSVDAAYRESAVPGMLISGRPGSGKTQQLLQMCAQAVYQGFNVAFLNPKREATLKPFFDHLGGITVTMSSKFLQENPGLLDPVFYHDGLVPTDGSVDYVMEAKLGRAKVADILADAVFTALKWKYVTESVIDNTKKMSAVTTEIRQRALDLRNKCSYDILFGNQLAGTEPISDPSILDFVTSKMENSPFWTSFISTTSQGSDLQEKMMGNAPILIEWDGSLQLPGSEVSPANYSPAESDSLLSVNVTFLYNVAILGNKRSGGVLCCDESWVFKGSAEVRKILNTGFREWRQGNILLLMGTQKISDWMGGEVSSDDMTTFFARILMMAITESDDKEIDLFYKFSRLERKDEHTRYMENAAIDKQNRPGQPPRAFYIDNISKWRGGIICGPFPELELSLGRTDKEGEESRAKKDRANKKSELSGNAGSLYRGVLSQVIDSDLFHLEEEKALEEQKSSKSQSDDSSTEQGSRRTNARASTEEEGKDDYLSFDEL